MIWKYHLHFIKTQGLIVWSALAVYILLPHRKRNILFSLSFMEIHSITSVNPEIVKELFEANAGLNSKTNWYIHKTLNLKEVGKDLWLYNTFILQELESAYKMLVVGRLSWSRIWLRLIVSMQGHWLILG